MFPFTLNGREFLIFYTLIWLLAAGGFAIYRLWSQPAQSAALPIGPLSTYQAAWLSGGARATFAVALTHLFQRGLVVLAGDRCLPAADARQRLEGGPALHPVELEVLRNLPHGLEAALRSLSATPLGLEAELVRAGFYQRRRNAAELAGPFLWIALALLGLGCARMIQGIQRGQAIGFLVMEMLFVSSAALIGMQSLASAGRTSLGTRQLTSLKAQAARSSGARVQTGEPTVAGGPLGSLTDSIDQKLGKAIGKPIGPESTRSTAARRAAAQSDPGLAVALYGTGVLVGSQFEDLHGATRKVLKPSQASGDSACGGWDVPSDGGSGGDSGSSCGGGGCGGCGS